MGWRRPAQITTDLRRLLRPGVKFLQAEVQEPGAADGTIGFIVSGSFTLW